MNKKEYKKKFAERIRILLSVIILAVGIFAMIVGSKALNKLEKCQRAETETQYVSICEKAVDWQVFFSGLFSLLFGGSMLYIGINNVFLDGLREED